MNQEKSPSTFIFIGRSGCGKGTHVDLFLKEFKELKPDESFCYIESGKKFRDFIEGTTYSSELSKKIMEEGKLHPEVLAVWVWANLMLENLKKGDHLVLDGTPRKLREAHVLETAFGFYGLNRIYVIHLDITREETKRRLALRGRFDDKDPKDVEERLDWFDNEVAPVIDFYKNNSRYEYIHINGERPIEEVHQEILERLALKNFYS